MKEKDGRQRKAAQDQSTETTGNASHAGTVSGSVVKPSIRRLCEWRGVNSIHTKRIKN